MNHRKEKVRNRYFLLIFLSIIISFQAIGEQLRQVTEDKIIYLRDKLSKAQVIDYLKANKLKQIAEGDYFIVVRTALNLSSSLLQQLQKMSAVSKIVESVKYYPQDCFWCLGPSQQDFTLQLDQAMQNLQQQLSELAAEKCHDGCHLFPQCADGTNPAWARMQIGADLADQVVAEILEIAPSSENAVVGVVDTGFDKEGHLTHLQAGEINLLSAGWSAGDPTHDEQGHGTAVTGMIAAQGIGVTEHVDLNIYRVSPEGDDSLVSSGMLGAAIVKACRESEIVNVSWGSRDVELDPSLILDEAWVREAAERGCLVIKSAGNRGIKKSASAGFSISDPFLLVEAVDHFHQQADFSSVGQITAPGEGVYTLLADAYARDAAECSFAKDYKIGPMNGTSFAAPAVSGVAAQVLTILKAKNLVPANPRDKITLLKSILLASTHMPRGTGIKTGLINALGAVSIAKNLTAENMTLDQDRLVELGSAADDCQLPATNCKNLEKCDERVGCVNHLRKRDFLCDTGLAPNRFGTVYTRKEFEQFEEYRKGFEPLWDSLRCLDETQLQMGLLTRIPTDSLDEYPVFQFCQSKWDSNKDGESFKNLTTALELIVIAGRFSANEFDLGDRMAELFDSYAFNDMLLMANGYHEELWDGSEDAFRQKVLSVFGYLSLQQQKELIGKLDSREGHLGFLYLLYEKIDFYPPALQALIRKQIDLFGKMWWRGELFNGDYRNNTKIYELFAKDHQTEIGQIVQEGKFEKEKASYFHLAMTSSSLITNEQRGDLAKKLLAEARDVAYRRAANEAMFEAFKGEFGTELDEELKDFILNAPYADVGSGFIGDLAKWCDRDEDVCSRVAQNSLWNEYLKTNLPRLKELFLHPEMSYEERLRAWYLVHNIISWALNAEQLGVDGPDQQQIMDGNKNALSEVLYAAAKMVVSYRDTTKNLETEYRENGIWLIEQAMKAISDEDLELFRRQLMPLRRDMNEHPDKYDTSLKDQMDLFFRR